MSPNLLARCQTQDERRLRHARGIGHLPTLVTPSHFPVHILLVEDNPSDVFLTEEALKSVEAELDLATVEDGEQALAFLRAERGYASRTRPDLVLLDLNLPRLDGRKVLAEMKSDPSLRRIPVIVLTTSTAQADIAECYDLHANCYIAKPVDFERFETVVKAIRDFWTTHVTLPPHRESA